MSTKHELGPLPCWSQQAPTHVNYDADQMREYAMSEVRKALSQQAQEIERLRVQRVPLTKDQLIDEFCRTPDLHQLVSAFFAGARFAEAAHGIHPPKAAPVNLCTYGYEIKSCTSEPMDCQCLLDSLNEEGPLQRLADLSKEIGEKL